MSLVIPALQRHYKDNPNFQLNTIEFTLSDLSYSCVIGPNGCGKSSFGNALAGSSDSNNWFYVPQYLERFLYAINLKEQLNSLFGLDSVGAEILPLLRDVGFEDPQRLLTFPFVLMSGGERRRIALACALYVQPQFLILDEPDIGVSAKESMVILRKLNNLRAIGTSLILITHNQVFVDGSSDLVCLQGGSIQYVGGTQELLADPEFDLRNYGVRTN